VSVVAVKLKVIVVATPVMLTVYGPLQALPLTVVLVDTVRVVLATAITAPAAVGVAAAIFADGSTPVTPPAPLAARFTAVFMLFATQDVQVPVRLVITPLAGVPSTGAVNVVPLGSCSTPVADTLIVEFPLVEPFSTTLPPVPPFVPRVALLVPVMVVAATVPPERLVAVAAVVALVAVAAVFAVMLVLQLNPVPLVQSKALEAVEHEGTDCPVGATAVSEPSSWLAAKAVVSVPAVVALVAVAAALTVRVFASTTTGARDEPLGCHTGTKVCPVVHEEGCTLLVMVVAEAATGNPYCVIPERPLPLVPHAPPASANDHEFPVLRNFTQLPLVGGEATGNIARKLSTPFCQSCQLRFVLS
jgi:hypothetical protein